MYSGARTRNKKRKKATPASTVPSPVIPLGNIPDIQQDIQIAVKDAVSAAIGAAIPAIVDQLRADQPSHNPIGNVTEQQESEANMTIHDHIQSLTGEQQATVTYDYDQGVPLDFFLTDKQRKTIISHQYIDFATLVNKVEPDKKKPIAISLQDDNICIVRDDSASSSDYLAITAWISRMSIYSTVLCRADSGQAVGLFHYLEHIRKLKDRGIDWSKYDISYRKLHASNPSLYPFGRDLIQLQMECSPSVSTRHYTQPPANQSQLARYKSSPWVTSGRSQPTNLRPQYHNSSQNTRYSTRDPPPFPMGTCWIYQNGKTCSGGCHWPDTHKCCYCAGNHPGIQCYTRNPVTSTQTTKPVSTSRAPTKSSFAQPPKTPKP